MLMGENYEKIWTDFNEPDMNNFRLNKEEVEYFDLKVSERIIFYTEDIQVEAIVFYDNEKDRWFGKIDSEFIDMPHEIAEAREDGFINGKHFGEWSERYNIIRNMSDHGIPRKLAKQITGEDDRVLDSLGYNEE